MKKLVALALSLLSPAAFAVVNSTVSGTGVTKADGTTTLAAGFITFRVNDCHGHIINLILAGSKFASVTVPVTAGAFTASLPEGGTTFCYQTGVYDSAAASSRFLTGFGAFSPAAATINFNTAATTSQGPDTTVAAADSSVGGSSSGGSSGGSGGSTGGGSTGGGGTSSYVLALAGPTTLGGVKINGNGLAIDSNGVLSVTGGGSSALTIGTVSSGSTAGASITSGALNLVLPTGAAGAAGATPNVSIGTITTLAAGAIATAAVTGTAPNFTLNLGIPQGAPGSGGSVAGATASAAGTVILASGASSNVLAKVASTGNIDDLGRLHPELNGGMDLQQSNTGSDAYSATPPVANTPRLTNCAGVPCWQSHDGSFKSVVATTDSRLTAAGTALQPAAIGTSVPAFSDLRIVNALPTGITGTAADGATNDASAFGTACVAGKEYWLKAGASYLIGTNTTLTCNLHFVSGAQIIASPSTVTVNITGKIYAPNVRIFSGPGTFTFGPQITDAPVEWFGAVGVAPGVTGTDSSAAIAATINALTAGTVRFQALDYAACGVTLSKSSVGIEGTVYGAITQAVARIVCNSPTATIVSIAGTSSSSPTFWNYVRRIQLRRSVAPTTGIGLSVRYAAAPFISEIDSADSFRGYYFQGGSGGTVEKVNAGWGFSGLTYSGVSPVGFYLDSTDGNAVNSLYLRNVSASDGLGLSSTGFTAYGSAINDFDVDFLNTNTANGIHVEYTGGTSNAGASGDIHFHNITIDATRNVGVYVSGIAAATLGSVDFTEGYVTTIASGSTKAFDIESSSGVTVSKIQIANSAGDGVYINGSSDVSFTDNIFSRTTGTMFGTNNSNNIIFTGNILRGDSANPTTTMVKLTTTTYSTIANNTLDGYSGTGISNVSAGQISMSNNSINPAHISTTYTDASGSGTTAVFAPQAILDALPGTGASTSLVVAANGIAAHKSMFLQMENKTVPYGNLELFASGDPLRFGATQFVFQGGPALFGNTSTVGSAAVATPSGAVAAFGTTNQSWFDTAGVLHGAAAAGGATCPVAGYPNVQAGSSAGTGATASLVGGFTRTNCDFTVQVVAGSGSTTGGSSFAAFFGDGAGNNITAPSQPGCVFSPLTAPAGALLGQYYTDSTALVVGWPAASSTMTNGATYAWSVHCAFQ